MGKMGAPKKAIDEKQLRALLRLNPTLEDTAAFFQCSARTIENYIRDKFDLTFFEFRAQNRVHTRKDLQRKAVQMAMKGNVPMLIFCLKNLCKWQDRVEINSDENETPVQAETVVVYKTSWGSNNETSDPRSDD